MESVLLFSLMFVCLADGRILCDPWSPERKTEWRPVKHSWSLINQIKYQHIDNELQGERLTHGGPGVCKVQPPEQFSEQFSLPIESSPPSNSTGWKNFHDYSIQCLIRNSAKYLWRMLFNTNSVYHSLDFQLGSYQLTAPCICLAYS